MPCKFLKYFKGDVPTGYFSIREIEYFFVEKMDRFFFVAANEYGEMNEDVTWHASPRFTSRQEAEDYLHEIMRKINGVYE